MPRVILDAYERKIDSFRRWFAGKRIENDITQEMLADKLNCSQVTISHKTRKNGKDHTQITYKDLLVFFDSVGATDEEIIKYMRM